MNTIQIFVINIPIKITRGDLERLNEGRMLNDSVIEFFMGRLNETAQKENVNESSYYFLSPYFFMKTSFRSRVYLQLTFLLFSTKLIPVFNALIFCEAQQKIFVRESEELDTKKFVKFLKHNM